MKPIIVTALCCLCAGWLPAQVDLELSLLHYQTGAAIADKTVNLQNTAIGLEKTAVTNQQGKALFKGLPISGAYTVSVAEDETYYPAEQGGISLRSQTNASVTLWARPKSDIALEEVVIGVSRINTRNAEVASELKQKEIETLPLEGRDITRILFRMPNVVQATGFYPEAPNVSINGANSLFTNYLIDGMDNNERFLGGMKFNLPVGFVNNINVLTNNFSTEYGLSANGVVNVTSRSGSNEFSGEAFLVTRPGGNFDAASPYAQRDLSGNLVREGFQRYQAGTGFGGAIRKDKTFYYLNFEHTTDLKDNLLSSPALNVNETVRGTNRFNYLSGKIDQVWNSRMRSSLRANLGLVSIGRQAGGLTGGVSFPSAANFQDRNSALVALQNAYLGDRFKAETNLQFSRFRWNYGRAENENSPQVTVLDPQELTIAVLGHPGYVFDSRENTLQAQQKFTFYRKRHTFKTGVEFISADHQLFGGGNPNGNYTVKLNEDQLRTLADGSLGAALRPEDIPAEAEVLGYSIELRPNSFGARQNILSAYLEDAIEIHRNLNLTLGLRYDYDNLSKGGSDQGDLNNLAPRISFNYRIGRQSSLRGGYGLFYDKILYAVYSDALQQNTTSPEYRQQLQALIDQGILPADTDLDQITFEGNLSGFASGIPYLQGPSAAQLQEQRNGVFSNERRILNPEGYQNPYSHQFSIGFQHQIDDELLFYADLVHNRSHNLFRLRDLNAPAPYPLNDPDNVAVRTQAEADLTRPVPIANNAAFINGQTLSGVARNIVVSETAGEARYTGLSLNLQKDRGDDDKISYRLIYTLSKLENNTEDINFRAQDANNFEAEWGVGINDRTHVINGMINWYPLRSLTLSMVALIQSGQPINRIPDATRYGTTDLNGDGRSFGDAYVGNSDRHPGESRNNDRLPWANTFDLSAQYAFKLGPNSGLTLRADVFNLFNAANLSGYSNNATQSNQIQTGARADGLLVRRNASAPRQVQFSLLYRF